jgi:hypothetical protein
VIAATAARLDGFEEMAGWACGLLERRARRTSYSSQTTVWGRVEDFLKNIVGVENFKRITEVLANTVTYVLIAAIVIIPLQVIKRAFGSNRIVHDFAEDSTTILTVGLVLSGTTKGLEVLIDTLYVKEIAFYTHEGVGVFIILAIFVGAAKALDVVLVLSWMWAKIRSLWT